MANFISRLRSLAGNIKLLAPFMGGAFPALLYLIKTKGKPHARATARYKGMEFTFRQCDISAIREVLLDGEYSFLKEYLETQDHPYIIDIGSHIGLFSIWTLAINPYANIVSIEASPETYDILSKNIKNSGKHNFTWRAENRAAWKNTDTISFSNSLESTMSHRIDDRGQVKVKGITLSDLLESVPDDGQKIDIMKIDIEGAEEAFLCADENISLAKIKNLVIELHPRFCDTENVMNILEKNFTVIKECHDHSLSKPLLFCTK